MILILVGDKIYLNQIILIIITNKNLRILDNRQDIFTSVHQE